MTEKMIFSAEQAGKSEIATLLRHRELMFRDMSTESYTEEQIRTAMNRFEPWLLSKLSDGTIAAFIAYADNGAVAGSGCVWFRDTQPTPKVPVYTIPYIMSMYTERQYRRMGVATAVLNRAIELSIANGHKRILLHASKYGRPVYLKAGFEDSSEMRMDIG